MENRTIYHELKDLDPDVEDPDEDTIHVRVQRDNMLELYSGDYPQLKLAYEDWERTSNSLQRRVKRGKEVSRFAKKEVIHLLWVLFVVEGVLLATLSQAQLLTCESLWICFHLSFLASLVLLVPLVQRVVTLWNVHARIASLLLALEVLSRRIHAMKTLGPLECTFDDKADDVVMHEVLKKPSMSTTVIRIAVISTTIFAFMSVLLLGVDFRCGESSRMPQRLQLFLRFSPNSLSP